MDRHMVNQTPHSEREFRAFPYNGFVQKQVTRRALLGSAAVAPFMSFAATQSTDIRVDNVSFNFEDYKYRTPIKFGGTEVDRVTLLNVNATVRNAAGKVVKGFGSMPLGNVWSFPSKTMSYDTTLNAMKVLSARIAKITNGYKEFGHPVDINWDLEPLYLKAADERINIGIDYIELVGAVSSACFDSALEYKL